MIAFDREIAKAERRLHFDLPALVARATNAVPKDMASPPEKAERLAFLRQTLDSEAESQMAFERVLQGNELQPVNYLERGRIASTSIARIAINDSSGSSSGWATGFLIAPRVLLTNNHVFESANAARASEAHFRYELDLADALPAPVRFALQPDTLFFTSEELDFSIVAVDPIARDGESLERFGWLPLLDETGKALEGEWLTIIQHPNGEAKQLCVRENRLLKRDANVVWYSTDTLPGSSGSPVFNNEWYVVALHHSGVPERKNGRIQTIDGTDYDARSMDELRVKWIANEGIRVSCIVKALKAALPAEPLLQPMYAATPASARVQQRSGVPSVATNSSAKDRIPMNANSARIITVPVSFRVMPDGRFLPMSPGESVSAGDLTAIEAAKKKKKPPAFDVPFNTDYTTRKGYKAEFLGAGALRVGLPAMSEGLETHALPLIKPVGGNKHVLHYNNYSVVMHAERRFAIYSAANVSFAHRFEISRPSDVWRVDPRIPVDKQVQNSYYESNNFDRGHLTRNEDLEFGATPVAALQSAADTCHWTNCTPQHFDFNQNKEVWQGIERHILETSIFNGNFNAQVITGPIFDEGDPVYRKLPYPVQYWKVVAALDDKGDLFATAYIASQADAIARHGIEATVPFGPYKTFQTTIAEIERLTGLTFGSGANDKTSLSKFDPLAPKTGIPPRRRRTRINEAFESTPVGADGPYLELRAVEDIEL